MPLRNVLQQLVPRRAASRLGRNNRRALPCASIFAFLAIFGPGLVSAVAGDDAGGIATYAAVGAKYGYQLLWTLVLITISLAVVQEMAARLTVVTGKGLSDLIC